MVEGVKEKTKKARRKNGPRAEKERESKGSKGVEVDKLSKLFHRGPYRAECGCLHPLTSWYIPW